MKLGQTANVPPAHIFSLRRNPLPCDFSQDSRMIYHAIKGFGMLPNKQA